jgi:hypothetical protein
MPDASRDLLVDRRKSVRAPRFRSGTAATRAAWAHSVHPRAPAIATRGERKEAAAD